MTVTPTGTWRKAAKATCILAARCCPSCHTAHTMRGKAGNKLPSIATKSRSNARSPCSKAGLPCGARVQARSANSLITSWSSAASKTVAASLSDAQGRALYPPAALDVGQGGQLLEAAQTGDRGREEIQQQQRRIVIVKQLAVARPVSLGGRPMQALQELADQPDVLEALDYGRGAFPAAFSPVFPNRICFFFITAQCTRN